MDFLIKKDSKELESFLAEKKGFEPLQDLHPLAVFETAPFSRLGTSPACSIITTYE